MEPTKPTSDSTQPTRAKSRNIPEGDQEFSEAFDLMTAEWGLRPQLTLEWTTQSKASTLATQLRESLRSTGEAGDSITPQSRRLGELDKMIDGSKEEGKLKYVRKALALRYDEENDGKPYYGEFGIEKIGSEYTLPHDRGKRAKALLKLVKALARPEHGLKEGKYGHAFWKQISDEYNQLQGQLEKDKGIRATEVGDKNQYRQEAEAIFVAILLLLQANYPKTYKAERRKFGVLKESY
ncbi:hypothetical protein Q5H93_17665 [Hymenobacter sp. ASUV-10]|uniref:dATP/dGTP diphosphohydrolase N-terminal domain-containing protein n=1 Tax=Hymenobacter aranciens TaxID=3063996 RepID=A0ABT9BEA2_9BACT|nr:hypothetical protein [Hymenobacter sp. ASUV-10]MDO7876577.1 hypothetical protein [Hymenobacter sp. ASUV-10]